MSFFHLKRKTPELVFNPVLNTCNITPLFWTVYVTCPDGSFNTVLSFLGPIHITFFASIAVSLLGYLEKHGGAIGGL